MTDVSSAPLPVAAAPLPGPAGPAASSRDPNLPLPPPRDEANGSSRPAPTDCANSGGAESQAYRPVRGRAIKESRSSRYRGVQWDRNGGRWRARLHTDRTRHIGYFADEDEAAMAWDLAVLRYYGETQEGCKKLNFGEESIRRYRQEPSAGPGVMARRGSDGSNAPVMGFRGVVPHDGGKYRAIVLQNRLHVTIGVFATAEEAARAHDRAAIEIHGWGALTNFPISDYSGDANGTELKAQQAQQAQGPTRRPLLRRQGSMPAGAAYEGGTPRTLLRTGSLASMDASAKPSRASSVPNLQVLANGAAAVAQTGWATGLTTPQTLPHRTPFAAASAGMRAPSPVVGLNSAGALGPDTGAIVDRKRMRADNPGSAGPHHQAGTAEAGSQGTVAINGPLELSPEGQTTGQASAVTQTEDGTWRAVLSVDLGKFATQEEATRAFDRAALMTMGFTGCSYSPLPDIMSRAAQCHQQLPQLLPAGVPLVTTFRGVTLRGGSYIAQLDLGGRPYELGPFATELEAAKAYDKYSLLLHGVRAATNLPPWEYLATRQEVATLADAVHTVATQAALADSAAQQAQQTLNLAGAPVQVAMPLLVRAPSDLDQQHLLATSDVLASHVSGEHLLATRLSASGSIVFQGQFTDLQQAALQYTTHPAQPVGIQQQQQQMYLQNTQPQLQQQMYLQSTPSMPQSVMLRTISGAISMDTDARLTQAPVAVPLCGPQGSGSLAMPPLTTLPAVAPSLPAVTTTSGPSDAAAGQLPMPQMPLQFAPQPVEVQPQQMQQQVQVQQIAAPQPQQQQTPVETQAQLQAQTQQAPPQPAASQQTQLGVASVSAAGAAGAALAAATELGQELGQSTALAVAPTSAPIPMAMPAQPHMILPVATVVTPGSIAVAATPPAGLEAEDAAMLGAMAHGPVTMEDVTPVGVSPSPSHAPVPAVNGLVSLLSTGTTALAACTAAAALPTASSGGQELNVVS